MEGGDSRCSQLTWSNLVIHLDTNFLIDVLKIGTPQHRLLRKWVVDEELISISAVAWAEFLCGPLDPLDRDEACALLPNIEPLLPSDAERGAELFNLSGRRSRSPADCLIAACAIRCGATLATSNLADFEPFRTQGLDVCQA
jgi:predicted nucleic acid-binding protein